MGEAKKPGSIRAKAREPEAFASAIGREASLSFRVPKLSSLPGGVEGPQTQELLR